MHASVELIRPDAPSAGHQFWARLVWQTIRCWWHIALPIGAILASAVAGAIYYFHVPQYESSATLRLRSITPYIAFQQPNDSQSFVQTQIQMIKTRTILAKTMPTIELLPEVADQPDPIKWLQKKLRIVPVGKSELLEVSVTAKEPAAARSIVEAVVGAYLEYNSNSDLLETREVLEALQTEETERRQIVERLRETVREMTKAVTGRDMYLAATPTPTTTRATPESILEDRLISAEVDLEVLRATEKALAAKQVTSGQLTEDNMSELVESNPEISRLKRLIDERRFQLHDYELKASNSSIVEKSKYNKRLEREIREYEDNMAELRNKLREEISASAIAKAQSNHAQGLSELREQIAQFEMTKEFLRGKIASKVETRVDSEGDAVELEFKRTELAHQEAVLERISSRIVALRTELGAPKRIAQHDPALLPTMPIEAAPWKLLMMGIIASLVAPFVVLGVLEQSLRRVHDSNSLNTANLPVFGEIAALPTTTSGIRATVDAGPSTLYEESVDSLRASLQLSASHRGKQVLAITSAVSAEGKTHLASQLAVSIAQSTGETTLLIDADMRSPDIHHMFGISNDVGLADVLCGEQSATAAINSIAIGWLHILPAGYLTVSPKELLSHNSFPRLIEDLRKNYRHIIIDTPPVLGAAETLAFISASDGTVLCAMRERSRQKQVEAAYARLAATQSGPIGVVIGGIPARSYEYAYGRYEYGLGKASS